MTSPSPILVSAHKVAVVGLGLIGGSVARRLVAHHRYVTAWNHSPRPYAQAQTDGIECVDTLDELAAGKPDILILAVPLEAMGEILARLAPVLSPGTTLTDVGSVKGPVRSEVAAAGLGAVYVGAHPMAGNEKSGYEASSSELLDDALWALTFDETTDYSRFLTVADMVTKGLDNRAIAVDDATHDKAAALISHMPHVVATALATELVDGDEADPNVALALAAGSWRDMTRVSLTDPERTRAMVALDATNVAVLLESMAARLTQAAHVLAAGDDEGVRELFERAQPFRDVKVEQARRGLTETEPTSVLLEDSTWRNQLLASARLGERIVEFRTTHDVRVVKEPVVSSPIRR